MGTTGVSPVMPFSPTMSPASTSSTSSMTHPLLSARRTHRRPQSYEEAEQSRSSTLCSCNDQHSSLASDIGSVIRNHCPHMWESRIVVPHEVKEAILHELSHHYELTNLNANQNHYINELCAGMFTQWKSDLQKHYEKYDGLKVVLAVGCPKRLVDRRDE
ncbi:hypothetical protein C1H46_005029 [Malus baccata]|uniref:Uncharacterized protein n=1 Tax=Malus baccata TaxID=106549 RepID=A0A540NED3_MALBA|nr:hypothetical protein C1H46_005029 [Malus baccata]